VRIIFDQGTPVPLRQALTHHEVATAYERGWSQLKNGKLLDVAENHGFQVFVSTDLNLGRGAPRGVSLSRIGVIRAHRAKIAAA
jgi:hypothetical protein